VERSGTEKDRLAAKSAEALEGVSNRRQLRAIGLSDSAVDRRLRTYRLSRTHPGTFKHAGVPGTWRQEASAALVWLGEDCYLTGTAAARIWQVSGFSDHPTIHITGTKNIRRRQGVRYRRTTALPPEHVTDVDGFRVTTPARTAFDLASDARPGRLGHVIDEFLRRGLMTLDDVADVMLIMGTKGRKGMAMLRRLLAERMGEGGPAHNKTELRLYKSLSSAGLKPTRQFRVDWSSGAFYLDCAWPKLHVGAESDSYRWHGTRTAWDRDKDRERILKQMGWRIVRFTWEDIWFRPDFVVAEVRKELAAAEALQGGAQ
jgi:very-short-patch-repair endonuclease